MDLENVSWKYIGEGNCHVVLELLETKKVLRLLKQNNNEEIVTNNVLLELNTALSFVNKIMIPLILGGTKYSDEVFELIELYGGTAKHINQLLNKFRPISRNHKKVICTHAILASNYIIPFHNLHKNNTYCIEIKCKQGWMNPEFKQYGKCYFCLKQHLKVLEKKVCSISGYCPLDLFSGIRHRMKKAIFALFSSPQNNFKMFHNMNEVCLIGEKGIKTLETLLHDIPFFHGNIDLFANFLIEVLTSDMNKNFYNCIQMQNQEKVISISEKKMPCTDNGTALTPDSVLGRILSLQLLELKANVKNVSYKCKYQYALDLLKLADNCDLSIKSNVSYFLENADDVQLFMLSAIAKDCSIMIAFEDAANVDKPKHIIKLNNRDIACNIAVTDLEPKSINTLEEYTIKKYKVIESYLKYSQP